MGNARFSDDFKRDAVHQVTVRGYPVKEVSQRLGVSIHSLYSWVKKYSKPSEAAGNDHPAAENRRLKRELARVTEERDILKKATVFEQLGRLARTHKFDVKVRFVEIDLYVRTCSE